MMQDIDKLRNILETYYAKYKDSPLPSKNIELRHALQAYIDQFPFFANLSVQEIKKKLGKEFSVIHDFKSFEQVLKAVRFLFSEFFTGKTPPDSKELFELMMQRINQVFNSSSPYFSNELDISDITWLLTNVYPETFLWYDQTTLEAARYLNLWPPFNKTDSYAQRYRHFMKNMEPIMQWFKEKEKPPFYLNFLLMAIYYYEIQQQDTYTASNTLHTHLESLTVNNFLSIKSELKLQDFSSNEIYLVGENGTGKTVLLQSLLIAFKKSAIREEPKQNVGVILDLIDKTTTSKNKGPFIQGAIYYELHKKGIYKHDKSQYLKSLYIKSFYAYGVYRNQRASNTEVDPYGYLSLFTQNFALRDPVTWIKQLKFSELEAKEKGEAINGITLQKALRLVEYLLDNEVKIEVDAQKVSFIEKDTGVTFNQLADGYKTVMIWTIDLLSRLTEDQSHAEELKDFRATVLVDEVDMFLHPRWAYQFMQKLRKKFPNVQFIVTTHNPIFLLGASKDAIFYKIYKENGSTQVSEPVKDIKGLSANSLITSPLWGLSKFVTKGTSPEEISSDDYPYLLIHRELEKRIKEEPGINEEQLRRIVRKKLDEMKSQGNETYQ